MEIEHVYRYRTLIAYKVATVGVVGRDPEVKYLPNGQAVANFSITNHIDSRGFATTSGVLKRFDVNAEVANEVTVIGWLAEVCSKYLAKGREVHITGQLQKGIYFVGAPRNTGLGEDVARGDKVVTRWLSEYGPGARR
jgi:single stranded DNA-binding protein